MNRQGYYDYFNEREIARTQENAKLLNYEELKKQGLLESCFYDELPNTEIKGFPYASDFSDAEGNSLTYDEYAKLSAEEKKKYRLKFYYLPTMHELYIGTTGSGKTTTCIEPQIRAITSQKNKPNIFVSDPKGEIFLHNVKHLLENGYNVQVLNFKNIKHSHTWNPLEELYLKEMDIDKIGTDAEFVKGNKVREGVMLTSPIEAYKNGYHIIFDGKAFPTYEEFDSYVDSKKFTEHANVSSLANQLCSQMFPDDQRSNDPTWSNGAREYFNGIILALLNDARDPKKHFKKEMLNIRTINDVYTLTTKYNRDALERGEADAVKFEKFLTGKSKEALDKIEIVAKTADSTKKGFLSTCQSMIGKWMNGHIFALTTETNITLDDSKNPIALFIITRDYDKSDNAVAGLFLNWVYRQFLEKAEKTERVDGISGGRPIHFMLDEFANIPAIPDFEIKIATSRSRNMWFHLYLQSYEQLNSVYKQTIAGIIIDNCNQQTFLGSQSYQTKERFSKECGQRTIVSKIDGRLTTQLVLPISELNEVDPGWMYTKRNRWDVVKSTYVRSYQCAKEGIFKDFDNAAFEQYAPLNKTNPNHKKYIYNEVVSERFLQEDDFLTTESNDENNLYNEYSIFIKNGGSRR